MRPLGRPKTATALTLAALLLGILAVTLGAPASQVESSPSGTAAETGGGACPPGRVAKGSFEPRVDSDDGVPQSLLPLAQGNPFTTALPDSVPLVPLEQQAAFRDELGFLIDQTATVEQDRFSASLFIVSRDGDIYDTAGRRRARDVAFIRPDGGIPELNRGIEGRGWPVASWMQPDPGEGHMALYNPETGAYGEFFGAQVAPGRLDYEWGGYIPDVRVSQGTSPSANKWWGASSLGLNLASVTITDREIREAVERYQAGDHANAYIPHILGYEAFRHHPNEWHYPASKTDAMGNNQAPGEIPVPRWGEGGNPDRLGAGLGSLRMGGIFRLDPDVDIQRTVQGDGTPAGDMMARIIARTLQRHGATMTDQTQAGFALLAEHVRRPDGSYDTDAFGYGDAAPSGQVMWLEKMMRQAIGSRWVQLVATGRNLETDTGEAAPVGAYRPPC